MLSELRGKKERDSQKTLLSVPSRKDFQDACLDSVARCGVCVCACMCVICLPGKIRPAKLCQRNGHVETGRRQLVSSDRIRPTPEGAKRLQFICTSTIRFVSFWTPVRVSVYKRAHRVPYVLDVQAGSCPWLQDLCPISAIQSMFTYAEGNGNVRTSLNVF